MAGQVLLNKTGEVVVEEKGVVGERWIGWSERGLVNLGCGEGDEEKNGVLGERECKLQGWAAA